MKALYRTCSRAHNVSPAIYPCPIRAQSTETGWLWGPHSAATFHHFYCPKLTSSARIKSAFTKNLQCFIFTSWTRELFVYKISLFGFRWKKIPNKRHIKLTNNEINDDSRAWVNECDGCVNNLIVKCCVSTEKHSCWKKTEVETHDRKKLISNLVYLLL